MRSRNEQPRGVRQGALAAVGTVNADGAGSMREACLMSSSSLLTLVAFGLLAVLVGVLDRRLSDDDRRPTGRLMSAVGPPSGRSPCWSALAVAVSAASGRHLAPAHVPGSTSPWSGGVLPGAAGRPDADQHWRTYAMSVLGFSLVGISRSTPSAGCRAPAAEPRVRRPAGGRRLEHGGLVRHQHQLAVVLRRVRRSAT